MKLNFSFDRAFSVFLVIASIFVLIGMDYTVINDPFRDGKVRYLYFAFAAVGTMYLWQIHRVWALFAGYSFALWAAFGFQGYGVIDVISIPAALVVGYEIKKRFMDRAVFLGISILAGLQALYGLFQIIGFDPFFSVEGSFKNVAIGSLGHHTIVGPFLALGAYYFFQYGKNYFDWFLGLFICQIAVLTGSVMTLVSMAAGFLFMVFVWNQMAAMFVVLGLAVFGIIGIVAWFLMEMPAIEYLSFSGRIPVWEHAIKKFLEEPIFGFGPGGWSGVAHIEISKVQGMPWLQVHNEYLQVLVEQGLIGFMLLIVGILIHMRKTISMPPIYGGMSVCICVNSLGNFPMHIATFGLIAGWLCCAVENQNLGATNGRTEDLTNKPKRHRQRKDR